MIKKIIIPLLSIPASLGANEILSINNERKEDTANYENLCDVEPLQKACQLQNVKWADKKMPITLNCKQLIVPTNNYTTISGDKFIKSITNRYEPDPDHWGITYGTDSLQMSYHINDWISWNISKFIYTTPTNLIPFSENNTSIFTKAQTVWGTNEIFRDLHADVVFSRDGKTPYLFNDINDLETYCPEPLTRACRNPFSSFPLVQLVWLNWAGTFMGCVKWIEPESIQGELKCYSYSLKQMFQTRKVEENSATFGTNFWFQNIADNGYFNHFCENKLNLKLYYQTVDANNPNKNIKCVKEFKYTGVDTKIDVKINNGVFIPLGLESMCHNDENVYIQGEYCDLTDYS
ncbi:MAG: hypothetical protein LBB95_00430 [Mycoplasmataceae bacterium]|nr:hypothetical protein [Mycoplasmataceae bacterium]